jgi:glycosyltransferase involved in cell wall biosynthesis
MKEAPAFCCVIGDGPNQTALVRRAAGLGLGESVQWSGGRPDASRLFAAFDAFALSSRTEGTPIVLFEAMAAGVPIVASRVGGVPDVVGEREAWLVGPEDSEALANALIELQGNRPEAVRRAEAARQRLSAEFRVEPWLDAYEAIYWRLCGYGGSATAGRGSD